MISIKPTQPEEAEELKSWFTEPGILRWFPMIDDREIDDAVRLWMAYCKLGAAITIYESNQARGMALLYIQPFKKLIHQCLFTIIVDEKHRGKGFGTQLLEGLCKLAKEKFHVELLHLEVYEGNPAIRLYQRCGFQEFGKQEHFIKEDGIYRAKIFMQKSLL